MSKYNSLSDEEQAKYLENSYGITELTLYETIQHWCPLGDQVGTTKYTMTIRPGKQLAELCELHYDLMKLIGTTYSLESGLELVLNILKKHYTDAKYIKVIASCPTNKHMACDAVIEYSKED